MRTTVFFKGCPLHCLWCQNPEGMEYGQEVWWDERKCIKCLACQEACPNDAILAEADRLRIDRSKCQKCGECVEACPSQAMAFTGKEWTLTQLVNEAIKDKDYYESFGGGVTVSGGEPLGQFKFVTEFFRALKEKGIHTALDTSGLAPVEAFDAVLPYTDHVLYDVKMINPELHRKYTGKSNQIILNNLIYVSENYIRNSNGNRKLWIRTPLVPEATAAEENDAEIGRFIHEHVLDVVERWELCAFNSACISKYRKMGQSWIYENTGLMAQADVDKIEAVALASGIPREKLVISGLIAKGERKSRD
jgi:pyruvate formate lyase activating enzyme